MGTNSDPLRKQGSMFYGALLLTLGSIAIRFVQLGFQVYISKVLGAAGLGQMQLILTVASFAGILSSGGVRIAVTCLAAEEAGRRNAGGLRAAVRCCFLYGTVLSLLTAWSLYVLSPHLTSFFTLGETGTAALRLLALFLPVNCLWAILAGFYTATGRVVELVLTELGERILFIGLVILLMAWQDPCLAVFSGSSLATVVSFFYLLLRYLSMMRSVPAAPSKPMLRRLIHLTLPLGFNDMLRSGLGALEDLLIPQGLRRSGRSHESAMASYGTIGGMVFPVIKFPSILLYSLSDLLVPEMARSQALSRRERIVFLTDKCLRLTVLFAAGVSGFCFLEGMDLGLTLFGSQDAGTYIRIFSPLVLILYVDAITDGILKGLSQQIHSVRYNTFTSLLDVGMLWLLLPRCGIGGFLAAYTVSHGMNFFLSLRRLMLVTSYYPNFYTTICCSACCIISVLVMGFYPADGQIGPILLRSCGYFLLYGSLILLTGAMKRSDLRWLRGQIRRHNTA